LNKQKKLDHDVGTLFLERSSAKFINPSSFYSTIDDIESFMSNSRKQIVGGSAMHQKLAQTITLDDGSPVNNNITIPTISQRSKYVWDGLSVLYQISSDKGFSSSYYTFPDADFSSFVVTNNSEPYNGNYTWDAVDIILAEYMKDEKLNLKENIVSVDTDISMLKKFEGVYLNREFGTLMKIYFKNDTLRSANINGSGERPYVHVGQNKFQWISPYNVKLEFEAADGHNIMAATFNDSPTPTNFSVSYPEYRLETQDRQDYIGEFYCEQLDLTFSIRDQGDHLSGQLTHHGDINLMTFSKDLFYSDKPNFHGFEFIRNEDSRIIALELNYNRNNIIWFDKK